MRCSTCQGRIVLLLNKKDKFGNVNPTPARGPVGFAKFVKDNFKKYNRDNLGFQDVMRVLSAVYGKTKGSGEFTEGEQADTISRLLDNVETLTIDDGYDL